MSDICHRRARKLAAYSAGPPRRHRWHPTDSDGWLRAPILDRCCRWANQDESARGIQERIDEMEAELGAQHQAISSERRLLAWIIAKRDRLKVPEGFESFEAAIEHMRRVGQWR